MQPLSFAMNAFGRSLGQHDLYPFALEPGVIAKLDYIGRLVASARTGWSAKYQREEAELCV